MLCVVNIELISSPLLPPSSPSLKGCWGTAATAEINDLLEGVKLTDVANKHAGKFSGGMRRRLSVAISAVGAPSVIFLDEPTTGMDLNLISLLHVCIMYVPVSRKHLYNCYYIIYSYIL